MLTTAIFNTVAIAALSLQAGGLDSLTEAPKIKTYKRGCVCEANAGDGALILKGLVVDAVVTLGADERSVNERQTTIFDISYSSKPGVNGRTEIWHSNNTQSCGLTFDYGKIYKIAARETEEGALETDQCLMNSVK